MTLTPKAEEKILEWAIHHWKRNDTQAAWPLRQFVALAAEAQGVMFDTKDGLLSNGWYFRFEERHLNLTDRTIQQTDIRKVESARSKHNLCFPQGIGGLCGYLLP